MRVAMHTIRCAYKNHEPLGVDCPVCNTIGSSDRLTPHSTDPYGGLKMLLSASAYDLTSTGEDRVPLLPLTALEEKESYGIYHGISGRGIAGPTYLIRATVSSRGIRVTHNTRVFYDEATEIHLSNGMPLFYTQLSGIRVLPISDWWLAREPYDRGLNCASRVFISRLSASHTRHRVHAEAWRHDIINNVHGQEAAMGRMELCCSPQQVKDVRDGNVKEVILQLLVQSSVTVAEHSVTLLDQCGESPALADQWTAHLLMICATNDSRTALDVAVGMVRRLDPMMLDRVPDPDEREAATPLEAANYACCDAGVPPLSPLAPPALAVAALGPVAPAEAPVQDGEPEPFPTIRGYSSVPILPGGIPVPFRRSIRARFERLSGAAIPGGSWNPSFVYLSAEAVAARNPNEQNLATLRNRVYDSYPA